MKEVGIILIMSPCLWSQSSWLIGKFTITHSRQRNMDWPSSSSTLHRLRQTNKPRQQRQARKQYVSSLSSFSHSWKAGINTGCWFLFSLFHFWSCFIAVSTSIFSSRSPLPDLSSHSTPISVMIVLFRPSLLVVECIYSLHRFLCILIFSPLQYTGIFWMCYHDACKNVDSKMPFKWGRTKVLYPIWFGSYGRAHIPIIVPDVYAW